MKSKVISLTKVFLKSSFQKMKQENTNKKSKSMIVLYIISFGYLAAIMGFFSYQIINMLIEVRQEQLFIGIIFMGVMAFLIFQTIFSSISILYYTKDNEYILPLPIKPSQIIMAKTNVLLLTEYLIESIIGLIPLLIYGILTGAGIMYYLAMAILLVVFPILPVIISSLLVMIVMSFARFSKNRNRFQVIASVILIIAVCIFSTLIQSKQASDEEIIQMISQANGMVQMIEGYFPTLGPAVDALTSNSTLQILWNLLQVILITGITYFIYILVAQKLYFKGMIGSLTSGIKTKKKINDKVAFKKSNLAKTYIGKEFKILVRNPVFLMQCILPSIIFPVLFIGISFMGMQSDSDTASFTQMFGTIGQTPSIILGAIVIGIIEFLSMFIYISITAISRDGQNAAFMKYIPVPYIKQIEYKIAPNIIMSTIMNIITFIIIQNILNMEIIFLILLFITATIITILQSYLMIIIDLKKPKLEWNSEYAVVKQNMNLIWPVIFGLANITVIAIVMTIFSVLNISPYIAVGIIGLIYLAIIILIRNYIQKNQITLFEKVF